MTTRVYIDGFNLYNGCLKNTPYKWLDLDAFCNRLLPGRSIDQIRYFTAGVKGFAWDPDAPTRQSIYLRALRTLSKVTIHKDGWFAAHPVTLPRYPLVYPSGNKNAKPVMVRVRRMEEKRTDVDLATYLLLDCFDNLFDEAVVISNDSDLVLPVEVVRTRFKKKIGVVNPHPKSKLNSQLTKAADFHLRKINASVLKGCQLPDTLTDAKGTIAKPTLW